MVVPTKNEGPVIRDVIQEIRRAFDPELYAPPVILVVDDSTDETRRLAEEEGAEVLIGGGQGLGSAMYAGLKAAVKYGPDFIMSLDGDGQADAEEIPRFLQPLIDDEADMVLGSRFKRPDLIDYHYKFINRFGTIVLSRILRGFTNLEITDSHGGIRAMRPEVAAELEMLGTHTYVQETIIDAAEKGFRIVELPSVWRKRRAGKSRVVGSIPKYVFYTLPILMMRSGQHIRLLYSAGIVLAFFAMLYFFVVLAQAGFNIKETFNRLPAFVFIALLISLGFQCFFFGLVLQLLKQVKYQVDRANIRTAGSERGGAGAEGRDSNESTDAVASGRDRFREVGTAPRGHSERSGVG
ncbi:MAG: glycosyltransferase family 2 protein [Phycisphaerales bacterium]|nr:glycosyltransferase family 2 protein [Phycisphaerales bacterium]